MRVLHITDPHLYADPEASLRGTVTHDSLRRVLRHVADSGWSADLVAMTGDLIQDDSREAYERFRELLTPLGLPVYCVPGNHDVRPLMLDVLGNDPFYCCDSSVHGAWLIVGLDSSIEGSAAGRIAERELERLDGVLRDTRAQHAMICLHHPPLPIGSQWLDSVGLQNGEQFLQRIGLSGKVRIAIFGHAHQQFEGLHESIRIIGTPSTCSQFKVASDTYAVDDKPPAYRRISLFPDGTVDTDVIWVGGNQDRF
ncbi:MAG: metallophosphoesterase [Woeseiaceae bacterium]